MVAPAIIAGGIAAGGSILSGLLGSKKVKQPPEIKAAMQALTDFYRTGKLGDYTAGEAYGGEFGDFNPTDIEQQGLGRLSSLVSSGRPEIFDSGTTALNNLLTGDQFDPYSPTGEFASFKTNVEKNLDEGARRIKRNAAFGKSLYSTRTIESLGDLEEEGQNQLTGKLASLYDTYAQRKIAGIPLAFQAATAQQGLDLAPIEASQTYGSLTRNLNTSRLSSTYNDFLRQRQEQGQRVNAAGAILGSNVGPDSLSMPNAFSGVLNQVGSAGIQELIRQMYAK